jgi:hypothetical protein
MRTLGAPLVFMLRDPDGNVIFVVEEPPAEQLDHGWQRQRPRLQFSSPPRGMLSRVDTCRQPGSLDARSDATVKQQAMWSYRSPRVHKGWLSGTRGEVMPGRSATTCHASRPMP